MITNQQLTDVLSDLQPWGRVSLDFDLKRWRCELRVPGHFAYTQEVRVEGFGPTPDDAAHNCWQRLEDWRAGGGVERSRQDYLSLYARGFFDKLGAERMWRRPEIEPERPTKSPTPESEIARLGGVA